MKLPRNAKCPLHGGYYCCGRERPASQPKKFPSRNGITVLDDGREICSKAEKRRRKDRLLKSHPFCAACEILSPETARFDDYREVELAHKESCGFGGFKRDDRMENLCLMHKRCNREQGSRSLDQYLADKQKSNSAPEELSWQRISQ
jgi:hypothetical protein